jgi:signal transduction histidine kinase
MRGYNEMLLEDIKIKENPVQLKLVDGIYTGIIRMNEIVNSMLDIASIDTRTMELRVEPVSISHIIQSIHKSFAHVLKERHLAFEASNLSDLPPVDGDSEALRKVFYQIIVNAVKYTPDGGKISITGVPVTAGQLDLVRGGIEIIISDTGIGISMENIELIFNKFYQTGSMELHSTGKTKFKGAGPGLGLAIAKGIVEAHRGKIWAESPGFNEEKLPGSTFHVVLPLHYKSQPLPASE